MDEGQLTKSVAEAEPDGRQGEVAPRDGHRPGDEEISAAAVPSLRLEKCLVEH